MTDPKRDRLLNAMAVMGLAAIAVGTCLLSIPAAFIVVGTILLAFSVIGAKL